MNQNMVPTTRSEKIDQMNSRGVEDVPKEVLQNIFGRFETKSELLNLRMVCRRWASNVTEILGNRTNAQFREWNPVIQTPDKKEYFIQKVLIPTNIHTKFSKKEVIFPHNLVKELNPFPTNSVSLVATKLDAESDERQFNPGENKIGLLPLLRAHGANLKTLSLEISDNYARLKIEPTILFAELPNLKSVKIKNCTSRKFDCSQQIRRPHIEVDNVVTTLKNLGVRSCGDNLVNWLLYTFFSSLETLELEFVSVLPFVKGNYSKPDAINQLKSLKLYRIELQFQTEEGCAMELKNLMRLTINFLLTSAKDISRFIAKYRKTLTELSYNSELLYNPQSSKRNGNTATQKPIIFPLVNKLCLLIWKDTYCKHDTKMITKCFPSLKILQLVYFFKLSKEHMDDACHIFEILQLCSHIKKVEVMFCPSFIEYQMVHCHTYERENM